MKRFFGLAIFSAIVFTACTSGDKVASQDSAIVLDTSVKFNPDAVNKNEPSQQQIQAQPVTQQTPTVTLPATPTNAVSTTPSNTPAVTTTPVVTTQPVKQTTTTTPTTKGKSVGKLNPEHGQPGHRCDIPVGTPLSTPIQKTNPAQPNVQQVNPVSITPVTPSAQTSTTPPSTDGSVRLNPAHGQPGHDCTIEVGKPLKK